MSCHGIQEENYDVVVQHPKSLRAFCEGCVALCIAFIWLTIALLFFLAVVSFCFVWIPVLMSRCHKPAGIALENLSILGVTLNENNDTSTPVWQVSSEFNATFSMWNRNSVAKCFTTLRTMDVDVRFKNNLIVRQSVPLGFSLKPHKNRVVPVDLKGDHFTLKKELAPVMEDELRTGNVTLEFFFNTRYLIADRRSKWSRFGCSVVVKSPLVQSPDLKTLISQICYST